MVLRGLPSKRIECGPEGMWPQHLSVLGKGCMPVWLRRGENRQIGKHSLMGGKRSEWTPLEGGLLCCKGAGVGARRAEFKPVIG